MLKFERLEAVAAALDMANVDTDQIVPARFLWRSRADGFGDVLFHDLRRDEAGAARPDFVLNQAATQGAGILVAERNFGCGSSREHAVWALLDAGVRVVIAPSFGDIFFNNGLKNGLLPIVLTEERCAALRAAVRAAPGAMLAVDLERQEVSGPAGRNAVETFAIDPFRKQLLLAGQDDIGFTLGQAAAIAEFEVAYQEAMPWV